MRGVIIPNLTINNRKSALFRLVSTYLLIPFRSGLFGFAIFFTALLLVKTLFFLLSNQDYFIVNVGDVALSLIGFASFYLVRIFRNIIRGE